MLGSDCQQFHYSASSSWTIKICSNVGWNYYMLNRFSFQATWKRLYEGRVWGDLLRVLLGEWHKWKKAVKTEISHRPIFWRRSATDVIRYLEWWSARKRNEKVAKDVCCSSRCCNNPRSHESSEHDVGFWRMNLGFSNRIIELINKLDRSGHSVSVYRVKWKRATVYGLPSTDEVRTRHVSGSEYGLY